MRLSVKIAVYMLGVIAFAVVLLVYLTNAKFRSVQEEVERSQYLALALDVKATAERGLSLGLGLEQMVNLGAVLGRLKGDYSEIRSIQILDRQGVLLYTVGPVLDRETTQAALRRGSEAAPEEIPDVQTLAGEQAAGLMVPLIDAIGQRSGSLVLYYDRSRTAAAARAVTWEQARIGGVALLAGGLAALLLTSLYLRGITRGFTRMTRWLEDGERAAVPEAALPADDLEHRFHRVGQQIAEVETMVTRAETALDRR